VVFDAVGRSITRVASAAVAGPCGTVILLGLHEQNTNFDVAALIRSEIALQGCYGYSWEDLHRSVAWLASGFVLTGPWIDVRPLEVGPDAFLELVDRPGVATKIVMVP
jgi:threonine dehydrogenase-like Zn-dependent dehydrogenase